MENNLFSELKGLLRYGEFGFEKESLRVINSKISKSRHPKALGSSLCNKYITTDFSEAQLELITPPMKTSDQSLEFLDYIHHFVSSNIQEEILWPLSMPPLIESEDDIPIGKYGNSNLGTFKHIYRNGLSERYGRSMQAISGFHFNYSLPKKIWKLLEHESEEDLVRIRSRKYFNMLRNISKMNWLIIYLFGASPILTKNFLKKGNYSFIKLDKNTFYLPNATSLRMSEFGYSNLSRNKTSVSLNSLNDYANDLRLATKTHEEQFHAFLDKPESQLNSNILQIEDEYYAAARAKSNIYHYKRTSSNLLKGGVDFIELRSLDLDPFSRNGIDNETVLFLEVFLIYCFLKDSNFITEDETAVIHSNDLSVAKYGRKPNFMLTENDRKISLRDWGLKILDEMLPIAEQLDTESKKYINMINSIKAKINDPNLTLSAKLIEKLISKNSNYLELGNSIGQSNKNYYLERDISLNKEWKTLEYEANQSHKKQEMLEKETINSGKSFEDYKLDYFES